MGSRSQIGNFKLRASPSPAVTVAASILIRTSLSLGVGFSTSYRLRTSGGPYFVHTIAFMLAFISLFFSPFLNDIDKLELDLNKMVTYLTSEASAWSGLTRITESNGMLKSRTFLSNPYNAA